ncbi:MAG: hypothetical protein HC898_09435 [Phycisphaerales bacterium]|nr:hypothetical protein [Phycisphaerales bacterium]
MDGPIDRGRWQRTPVVLPILEKLDVIDEPSTEPPGLVQVMPEDLIPVVQEYVIGPGDLVTVTVFQLLVPGVESVQTRRVDELGQIRLPIIGPVTVDGRTPSELETDISDILVSKGVLRDPTVSVIVQEQRQNTFSVIGESTYASTAIGTYTILGREFRLLDAMSLARGVPGQIKKLYVIRPAPKSIGGAIPAPALPDDASPSRTFTPDPSKPTPPSNPADLIDDLFQNPQPAVSVEKLAQASDAGNTTAVPASAGDTATDTTNGDTPAYINVDGKWVRVAPGTPVPAQPANQAVVPSPSQPGDMPGMVTEIPVKPAPVTEPNPPAAPADVAVTPERGAGQPPMTVQPGEDPFAVPAAEPTAKEIMEARSRGQRVIEVPYDKLLEGDTRYNIIIRPGDVIRVPPPVIGNVYIGGAINRPGTYSLPGDKDLTLQQLVFAAGNLSALAIPERVDLIRRIDKTQQATVRVNLRAIFQGTAPDIFLKPNDTINIGTNFIATPLAVFRNGFRMSYGFGFVLDRNFDENVFGPRIGN